MAGKRIPIVRAREIAEKYGYHQVIILGREVGGIEWATTYGVTKQHCDVAAMTGQVLRDQVSPTIEAVRLALEEIISTGDDKSASIAKSALEKMKFKSKTQNEVEFLDKE